MTRYSAVADQSTHHLEIVASDFVPLAGPVDIKGKPLKTRLEERNAQLQLVENSIVCLEVGEDRRSRRVSRHESSHILVVGNDFLLEGIQKRGAAEGSLADILTTMTLVSTWTCCSPLKLATFANVQTAF